jgi:hypothetical protein
LLDDACGFLQRSSLFSCNVVMKKLPSMVVALLSFLVASCSLLSLILSVRLQQIRIFEHL